MNDENYYVRDQDSVLIANPKIDYSLRVSGPSKPLITFHGDGRITVSEEAQPTETARQVLEVLAAQYPQWLRDPLKPLASGPLEPEQPQGEPMPSTGDRCAGMPEDSRK